MCVNYANDIRDGNHGENTKISRCVKPSGAKVHHSVWWMDYEICEVQTPFKLSSKVKKFKTEVVMRSLIRITIQAKIVNIATLADWKKVPQPTKCIMVGMGRAGKGG